MKDHKAYQNLPTAYNEVSHKIIGAAIHVHRTLGPGLLESVYQHCLFLELQKRGLKFEAQARVPINYEGEEINKEFIIDFLIDEKVIVELKATDQVLPVHLAQLLTYMRLANKRLGLLINFNVPILKKGIFRRIL